MTGLPSAVTVGPFTYQVTTDETDVLKTKADAPDGDFMGHSDHIYERIIINPDQSRGQMADTLLHETLHALFNLTNLCNQVESEEKVVAALSPALLDVLRRNPAFVAFLVAP